MKKSLLIMLAVLFSAASFSQTPSDSLRRNALNVFMSASDYLRKEIPYINYVRDIKDAGVYIISTSQRTGSGGVEYTYFLVGQNENAGMRDTVTFVSSPDDTQDIIRIREVRTLKMALMRYVAKTPLSQYMNITFTQPLSETVSTDKWNSWVFSASVNGWLQGQQTYKSTTVYGNISAARITKDWKINLGARYSYGKDIFEISGEDYTSETNSKSFNTLIVRSISDHWSVGGSAYFGSTSYSNLSFSARVMPGIEYDLFPYSESTRRQLRLLYSVGFESMNFRDTTIYNRVREDHFVHSVNAAYEVIQKWGSIDVSLNYRNYLHKWSLNNLSLDASMRIRIAKGLNFNFSGGAALIGDQLSLVKGGPTTEEILLRRREQATSFEYYTSFGFSYTFGSIYNNVVNPRFGNSGGGGRMIIMN
jgi:hypothetical protein